MCKTYTAIMYVQSKQQTLNCDCVVLPSAAISIQVRRSRQALNNELSSEITVNSERIKHVVSSAAISIEARQLRHATKNKLHAEKTVISDFVKRCCVVCRDCNPNAPTAECAERYITS